MTRAADPATKATITAAPRPVRLPTVDRGHVQRVVLAQLRAWRLVLQCARTEEAKVQPRASIAAYQEVHLHLLGVPAPVEEP